LFATENYTTACTLVQEEREFLTKLASDPDASAVAQNGLMYLDYLAKNRLMQSFWEGWSHAGWL